MFYEAFIISLSVHATDYWDKHILSYILPVRKQGALWSLGNITIFLSGAMYLAPVVFSKKNKHTVKAQWMNKSVN